MAAFVSKAEHQRRLITVITCVVLDALALTGIVFAWKGASDLESGTGRPDTLRALRGTLTEIRQERRQIEQAYVDFSGCIGWRPVSGGTSDSMAEGGVSGVLLQQYLDDWAAELTTKHGVTDVKTSAQGEGLTLTRLFDRLRALEEQYRTECGRVEGEIKAQKARAEAATKDTRDAEKRLLDQIRTEDGTTGLVMDYLRLLKDLATLEREHSAELSGDGTPEYAGLEGEAFAAQQKLTDLKKAHLIERREHEERRSELITRRNWIEHRREEAKERKEPDGEILAVLEGQNVAYIDLLHRDRIFKGSRFKVYSLEKGGGKVDKGEIEVLEVRNDLSSKVSIVKTYREDDPIRAGDQIYNELFERGKTRRIAVAGRLSGRLSTDEVASLIRRFGDEFQEKVEESTNYVILGEGYTETENFRLGQEWGVKLLREQTLYDYLGVPHD